MMREPLQIKTPPTAEQSKLLFELERQYLILDSAEELTNLALRAIDLLTSEIKQAEANRI